MATYLDRILAAHRAAAGRRPARSSPAVADAKAPGGLGRPRRLASASEPGGPGGHRRDQAGQSQQGAARPGSRSGGGRVAAHRRAGRPPLSVLTDAEFFGGSAEDLAAARSAVGLPVLRKDFTVGAGRRLRRPVHGRRRRPSDRGRPAPRTSWPSWSALAGQLGLDALVEAHDEAEAGAGPGRRAPTWSGSTSEISTPSPSTPTGPSGWPAACPAGVVRVAESGIRDADDAAGLATAGFDAVLVGEAWSRPADPAAAVAGAARERRPGDGGRRADVRQDLRHHHRGGRPPGGGHGGRRGRLHLRPSPRQVSLPQIAGDIVSGCRRRS